VIDIGSFAGNVTINGIDVIGGSEGIRVQNSGIPSLPGTVLKAIRAEDNIGLFPPTLGVDNNPNTSWFAADGNACNVGPCPFFEIVFRQNVTVSQLVMLGNSVPPQLPGFNFLAGRFELKDANGNLLFDSGEITLVNGGVILPIPNGAGVGVQSVRFTATANEGPSGPNAESAPGFAELKVFDGSTDLTELFNEELTLNVSSSFGGAGIEVRGDYNVVSGAIAVSNDTGIQVSGNNNLIRSNKGNANNVDGFLIIGNLNDIRGNEANTNGATGFDVLDTTNNMLRSSQANRSSPGGPKENVSCEYSFANDKTQDLGGNKKDNANFVGTIPGSPKRYAPGCSEEVRKAQGPRPAEPVDGSLKSDSCKVVGHARAQAVPVAWPRSIRTGCTRPGRVQVDGHRRRPPRRWSGRAPLRVRRHRLAPSTPRPRARALTFPSRLPRSGGRGHCIRRWALIGPPAS
jgi:hypothetical protein